MEQTVQEITIKQKCKFDEEFEIKRIGLRKCFVRQLFNFGLAEKYIDAELSKAQNI